jgi:hypothetical protein
MTEELFPSEQVDAASQQGDPVVQPPKKDPYKKKVWGILSSNFDDFKLSEQDFYKKLAADKTYANKVYDVLASSFEDFSKPKDKFIVDINYEESVKKKDGTQGIGFSPYDFLNVGKPSSRTQLPLVGEYSQVQESKAAPKAKESSKDAIQNLLGFIKSGGKPTKGGGKTNQVAKSTQPTVSQNVREQAALGRLGKALVDPVTGTKIDRKTGLPTAYVNELNKQSTFKAPQISEEDKSIYLQSLGLNPNTTDVEVVNTPDFKQFKQTVDQEKKINTAIDNYWKRQDAIDMQKQAGFSGPFVSSRTSGAAFEEDLRKRLKSGDLVITNDEVTGEPIIGKPDYNPITSFLNLYNKSYDQKVEEQYTQNLSAADKIKHKEVKEYLASRNNDFPSVPSGFLGNIGAVGGTFAQALAKPTMTAIGLYTGGGVLGAPFLGTEASFAAAQGLRSVGDVAGWMSQMGDDSYEPTWEKVYNGTVQNIENPTYQQKIDAANKASEAATYAKSVGALEGMFFGIPLANLGPSIAPSVGGYLNTLKSIGRSSLAQMPQMTGASFLGQVGKGEIGRQFGSNETHSQIIQQGLESAWETAKFVGGMGLVHATQATIPHAFALLTNTAESPSKALTSKAKAIVTKFPEDVVADVYAKAEQEGVIPPGKANEILTDLQSYKESEAQVPKTVVDVDARGAIAGKIQKRDKLDQELKETKVNARKEEIKQEIAQIDAEIDNIYKGDDVLANEYDINGIPLNQDLPAPKQRPSFIPIENVEAVPAEELIRKQQEAPVIEGQQEVVPEQIDLSNFLESVKNKPIEELKMVDDINKANVTVEGTRNGYEVISGEKENSVGDIRQEASEARAKGQDTFTKETVKDGKKIYTLTDATVSDNVGRPGFKSASISFPEGTKVTMEDVMPRLKSELGIKAEVKPTEVKGEVKPTEELIVYHGGSVKDANTEGGLFVSQDKNQAEAYAKGNKGKVQEFKINKKDISDENEVRNIIVELGLKSKQEGWDLSKELMLHEILDPRFETSLSDKDLAKLSNELVKRGYKAIEMMATDVTGNQRNVNDILVLNPKETLKSEVKPTEVKAEVKPSEKNKEVFKNSQGNTVELENGKLVVKGKSGEVLSERASKKATEEYADNLDYSKGEKAPELPSEIVNPKQASQYVIEESKNPLEIAQAYIAEERLPSEGNTKFQAIAEYGLGRVTTDSYKRFGDVNKMEPATKLRYLTKEGFTVDQRAEEISGKTGLDITPQDIIDYIDKYPKGDYKVMAEVETNVALQAKDKFNKLTGLDLTPELANKVIDKELQKANKKQLDIIKEDYETAKQLEDAYWAEYKKTDGFTKESNIGEVNKPEAAPKPEKSLEKAYKDLTNIEKRQIINSKFDKLLEELKIEKICPTD